MSTLRVDRIEPYLSSSVSIEGAIQANAATTGSNTFVGDQNILGTITASIAEGFALVGGVGNISTLVATSSFGGGSGAGFPFTGDAEITGSLLISGGLDNDLRIEGRQVITGPTTGQTPQLIISGSDATNTIGRTSLQISVTTGSLTPVVSVASGSGFNSGNQMQSLIQSTQIFNTDISSNIAIKRIAISANPSRTGVAALAAITEPSLLGANNVGAPYQVLELQSQGNFTDGTVSFKVPVAVTGSLLVTGSTTLIGNLNTTPALLPENPPAGFQRFLIPTLSGSTNTLAVDAGGSIYWTPTPNSLAISSSVGNSIISPNQMAITNGSFNSSALFPTYIRNSPSAGKFIGISGDPSLIGFAGVSSIINPAILLQSSSVGEFGSPEYYAPIQFQSSQSFSDGRVTVTRPLIGLQGAEFTGSVSLSSTLQLTSLDPLPAGAEGQLANSGSNLFFFSGSAWNRIAFA